ncbi:MULTISPECIES: hypothetical protein [Brevibacillus]|nr:MULTISPECIES: hypothetical protein [Brevibacillus]RED21362.1 hypothetical protein DES34_12186 [Brevibacillus brevis]TQK42093.1 hypothetical protein FB479_11585 [Brevibacillus sp. AG162]GEC91711.1 hypothetical protein BBR01nite_40420 [Brevibacillus brevis]VEF91924.1 Uncharacterised protein [Brevibacillus brevis]
MKKGLLFLAVATLISTSVFSSGVSAKSAQPYKIEKVQTSDGQTANVYYFESEMDAEIFQKKKYSKATTLENQQQLSEEKNASLMYGYTYTGYHGNIQHFFKEKKVNNHSDVPVKGVKFDFSEQRSTKTSASVSADFPKVFKAQVGLEYTSTHTYTISIPVDIPAKHYGQVLTYNNTDVYKFKHPAYGGFNVYYPTESDAYDVYIVKIRN